MKEEKASPRSDEIMEPHEHLDDETYYNQWSYKVGCLSAGCVIEALKAIYEK